MTYPSVAATLPHRLLIDRSIPAIQNDENRFRESVNEDQIFFPSVPSLFQLNATEESCGLCRADTVFRSFLCVSPIHSIGTDI